MWIVSNDTIFAEALQIALREGGIHAEIISYPLASHLPHDGEGFVIDLDSVPLSPLPSPAITFTRFAEAHPGADLIRPFRFSSLVELVKERLVFSAPVATVSASSVAAPFLKLLPDGVMMNGKKVSLSPAERAVLALLIERGGECVPKEEIDALWQEKGGNTTAVYIRYLRKKLDEPSGLRLIQSIRGRGYCLCLPS